MASHLVKKNPWDNRICGRQNCRLCSPDQTRSSKCRQRSVLYKNTCLRSKSKGREVVYIGETGLSGKEICDQHYDDIKYRPDKSHMLTHLTQEHKEENIEDPKFKFEVLSQIRTAFRRQISEAVDIRLRTTKGEGTLLNNKQEFSRCVIPELEVSSRDKMKSVEIATTEI